MEASASQRRKRPWWQWVLLGLVVLMILGALFGEEDGENTATETKTVTVAQPSPATETTTTTEPTETLADAREAVDDDDYARAIAIAAALGESEEQAIRRRIANRLGRRAPYPLSAPGSGEQQGRCFAERAAIRGRSS